MRHGTISHAMINLSLTFLSSFIDSISTYSNNLLHSSSCITLLLPFFLFSFHPTYLGWLFGTPNSQLPGKVTKPMLLLPAGTVTPQSPSTSLSCFVWFCIVLFWILFRSMFQWFCTSMYSLFSTSSSFSISYFTHTQTHPHSSHSYTLFFLLLHTHSVPLYNHFFCFMYSVLISPSWIVSPIFFLFLLLLSMSYVFRCLCFILQVTTLMPTVLEEIFTLLSWLRLLPPSS